MMMTNRGGGGISNSQLHSQTPSCWDSCKDCCCCVFLLFTFLTLLTLTAIMVIALAINPKKPHLNLQQVGFQSMTVTPNRNDPTTATLSLTIRLVFALVNPNRVDIKCGDSTFTVFYRKVLLGKVSLSRFCFWQGPHSVREVVATVLVDRVKLPRVHAADFARDAELNDRVELRVLANVATRIRLINLDSPPLQVSVDCVIVLSPRKQSLTYKQCGLHGLNV